MEGVCPQTRICLKQAYIENLKPILVLNKIDRLILEKQMTPLDAYIHLSQVLEQVNAAMGNIFASDVMAKEVKADKNDYVSALEECDDSNIYFTPESGNVIFCSAVDGWAFRVHDFAKIYSEKLQIDVQVLIESLWGDFYFSAKGKKCVRGAQEKAKKPMFVQLILENIWNLYEVIAIRKDKDKIPAIAEKFNVKIHTRDFRQSDPKVHIHAIFSKWLPIERSVLEQVVRLCPNPSMISEEKATQLMCSLKQDFESLPPKTKLLRTAFMESNPNSETVIVFISKMVAVDRSILPENKQRRLTREELERKRELVKQRIQQRNQELENQMNGISLSDNNPSPSVTANEQKVCKIETEEEIKEPEDENVFIAFARVYSGTLKRGAKLFALTPKHDPNLIAEMNDPLQSPHISEVTIESLYLLMGKQLEELDEIPAGNIVGIRGLQEHVLKTATLSTTIYCPSFCDLTIMATPILRVAVEPKNPGDMKKLTKGLKLLNQADACAKIIVQENGEHVLVTLGEVHLERCIFDLETQYSKCALNVSSPIVPMKETIIPQAIVDMVNEAIVANSNEKNADKSATVFTTNKQCKIKILALPLPKMVTDRLEGISELLKSVSKLSKSALSDRIRTSLAELKTTLTKDFHDADDAVSAIFKNDNIVNQIWSFGPKKCGANILFNLTDFKHNNLWNEMSEKCEENNIRNDLENSFLSGFQLASLAGPLCEEPMHGVAFLVEEWHFDDNVETSVVTGKFYKHFCCFFFVLFSIKTYMNISFFRANYNICKRMLSQSFPKSTTKNCNTNVQL